MSEGVTWCNFRRGRLNKHTLIPCLQCWRLRRLQHSQRTKHFATTSTDAEDSELICFCGMATASVKVGDPIRDCGDATWVEDLLGELVGEAICLKQNSQIQTAYSFVIVPAFGFQFGF